MPDELLEALIEIGSRELTIVSNNADNGEVGIAAPLKAGLVRMQFPAHGLMSCPRQP